MIIFFLNNIEKIKFKITGIDYHSFKGNFLFNFYYIENFFSLKIY